VKRVERALNPHTPTQSLNPKGVPVTIFTDDESTTLESLYPDRDGFFLYLLILSDRVQEDCGEAVADGMRFLCAIRQRPYLHDVDPFSEDGQSAYWWCPSDRYNSRVEDEFSDYIPEELGISIMDDTYSVRDSLTMFLTRWADLPTETRTRLWAEWAPQEVTK
jgi:hypothetical protein